MGRLPRTLEQTAVQNHLNRAQAIFALHLMRNASLENASPGYGLGTKKEKPPSFKLWRGKQRTDAQILE